MPCLPTALAQHLLRAQVVEAPRMLHCSARPQACLHWLAVEAPCYLWMAVPCACGESIPALSGAPGSLGRKTAPTPPRARAPSLHRSSRQKTHPPTRVRSPRRHSCRTLSILQTQSRELRCERNPRTASRTAWGRASSRCYLRKSHGCSRQPIGRPRSDRNHRAPQSPLHRRCELTSSLLSPCVRSDVQ